MTLQYALPYICLASSMQLDDDRCIAQPAAWGFATELCTGAAPDTPQRRDGRLRLRPALRQGHDVGVHALLQHAQQWGAEGPVPRQCQC